MTERAGGGGAARPRAASRAPRAPVASAPLASVASAPLALVALLAGCGDPPAPPPPPASVEVVAPAAPTARRPTRRFHLARTADRCEIYAQDGDDRTEPFATPCPEYLRIGERIRIAGKTCFLENKAEPDREKPVVCPDPLTRFEKDVRAAAK